MSRFKGIECPVCLAAFGENDDIVVCPDCGAPHHRHCYKELSACKHAALHGGFIWKSPIDNAIQGYAVKEELEINEIDKRENDGRDRSSEIPDMSRFRDFIENNGVNRDYYEKKHEQFESRDIYGVSEREIMCFQGSTNPFLTEKYRRIAGGNKVSFNLMAMLLFPYTAFYSRMRLVGIIMTAVDFVLRLPYTLLFLYYSQYSFSGSGMIEANENFLIQMNSVLGFIQLIYRLLSLLFYDYIYLRWMTRKIKEIRERFLAATGLEQVSDNQGNFSEKILGEEYYSSLRAAGKPSFLKLLLDSLGTICALTSVMLLALNFIN